MLRSVCALAVLALPLAASGQIVHDVVDGIWFIGGGDGPETAVAGCVDGLAKIDTADPVGGPTPCADVHRFAITLLGGDDALFFFDLEAFALDPATPSTFDGGPGDDIFQIDLSGFPAPLEVDLVGPPTGAPVASIRDATDLFFEAVLDDPTTLFVAVFGPGDDVFTLLPSDEDMLTGVQVFGRGGADTVNGSGATALLATFFAGGDGDDELDPGGLDATFFWEPGTGTDRIAGGTGRTELIAIGGDDPLGIHFIRGFLDPTACALFDFNNGGGVIFDALDAALFSAGSGGIDLFEEVDCDPDVAEWDSFTGPDRTFFRGSAGGANRLDIDFGLDAAIFTDGFESGDVSSWSTSVPRLAGVVLPEGLGPAPRGPAARGVPPWDGIDYQDWPSFADPATSGPSTVVIRGKPDFPVTVDLGPDGAAGRGPVVDSLLVDPLGLPFTHDGSTIVIDGGPPITYTGAEAVQIGAPTAATAGPAGGAPALAVFPNPAVSSAQVRLTGAAAGAVRVAVVDVLGREVAVVHDGEAAAGTRGWALPTAALAPGLYVVRAVGAGWSAARPLAVAK